MINAEFSYLYINVSDICPIIAETGCFVDCIERLKTRVPLNICYDFL